MSPEASNTAKPIGVRAPRVLGLALVALVVLVIAGVYAYATSFSYFSSYDDQGFLMVTVGGFLGGHRLYTEVFTFYGPFYYCYEWLLHSVMAIPLTHDATTALCIVHWLVTSAVLALSGGLMTRSALIGFLVFMEATLHLTPLAREPGHPQELAALLLALAILVGARGLRPSRLLPVLAGIGAALVFTKVNVGIFYAIAMLLALASQSLFFASRPFAFWCILGLSATLPFLLMRPNLSEAWALIYSAQSCGAILAAGIVGYVLGPKRETGHGPLVGAGVTFVVVSAILILIVLLTGSPLSAMFEGLVRGPSRLGRSWAIPLRVPYCWVSGGLALLSATVVVGLRRRPGRLPPILGAAKLLYGVLGLLLFVTEYNRELGYLLPWSWLLLVPADNGRLLESQAGFGRTFLCFGTIWESLQAYPVAGTQAAVGTLLLLPVYAISLHDATIAFGLEPNIARRWRSMTPRTLGLLEKLAFASLLYLFAAKWCTPISAWRYYQSVPPLGLRGARLFRLPADQGEIYRTLTDFLENSGRAFYSPGFTSLYIWAHKTPSTFLNVPEALLLSDSQQDQVIAALQKTSHSLIVLNEGAAAVHPNAGPLHAFISQRCREIRRFGMFRVFAIN